MPDDVVAQVAASKFAPQKFQLPSTPAIKTATSPNRSVPAPRPAGMFDRCIRDVRMAVDVDGVRMRTISLFMDHLPIQPLSEMDDADSDGILLAFLKKKSFAPGSWI